MPPTEPSLLTSYADAVATGHLSVIADSGTTLKPAGRGTSWQSWSLFLDFDGTLVEFADSPADVVVPPGLTMLLSEAADAFGGALALLSGRPLADLDRLIWPLRLPAAGVHGLERRTASGDTVRWPIKQIVPKEMRRRLAAFAARYPGVLLEDKGLSIALHYRGRPTARAAIVHEIRTIADGLGPPFDVQEGCFVCELKAGAANKQTALEAFLREQPFIARRPIFVGDDLTDRDAFRAVHRHGGLAIAVGGRIDSRWRLPDPAAVRRWVATLVATPDPLA